MARAYPTAVVAVKVFVEEDEILPVRIVLELAGCAVNRTRPICIAEEDRPQPARNLLGNLPQSQEFPRTCRALHFVILAKIVVELLKRLDNQEVHWKPDRTAPVRISAKQARARLAGFVVQTMLCPTNTQHIRMVLVISRDSSDSIRR